MAELDLTKGSRISGYPRPNDLLGRELYRLLTVFAAGPSIATRRTDREGGCVYSFCQLNYEYEEIGRILLTIAAMLRSDWDAAPDVMEARMSSHRPEPRVGTMVPNLKRARRRTPLRLRESLNKILHSHALNLDVRGGRRLGAGTLRPFVHLYGMHRGVDWKATIDIFKWVEAVFEVLY